MSTVRLSQEGSDRATAKSRSADPLRSAGGKAGDLVAVLTLFSARLYGQRRGRKKTEAAIKALQETKP